MPEGHSVYRIARQFAQHFVGQPIAASSPQGRFAAGAAKLDGRVMTDARSVGKQLFLEFDHSLWLRVHLGLYGAWDFAGDISVDATTASAGGRMGQTNQRGTVLPAAGDDPAGDDLAADDRPAAVPVGHRAGQDSVPYQAGHSIGAPRRRLRMSEQEKLEPDITVFPPDPVGQVRVRLLTGSAVADLRGPTACEVLDAQQVDAVIAKLGPDPMADDHAEAEQRFVAAVRKKSAPIGILLMDQSVVSGIGNVYRAELLFRAGLNPHIPGKLLSEEVAAGLWRDWVRLMELGVRTGQMLTMDGLDDQAYRKAMAHRDDRHWVYHREGLPCRVCGTRIVMEMAAGRKLYWCPRCQA